MADAKQLRHEMSDVGAVGKAKTLLDKGLEGGALRVVGQGASQAHLCTVGRAEQHGQGDVPVDIGHWRRASHVKLGEVSKAFLNGV